jgi:hypothetical protein
MKLRTPKFLSPSALAKFESDRVTFYERYLSPVKRERPPQINYMAAGSAFDAHVKSRIHTAIFGESATKGSPFEFETIFENQVEPHIRDEVLERSTDLFQQYEESGAYGELLGAIVRSPYAPEMEFEAKGTIEGVPLLGKPDLRYINEFGIHVIADWKVNGAFSKTGASPVQGYKLCLDYGSKTHGKSHKKYKPMDFKGLEINEAYLEEFDPDWADQLAIYSWVLGEPLGGEDFVIRMEQVACRPVKDRVHPRAKFATHLSRISKAHQESLLARIKMCWETIQSGHIFTDLSREESDIQCQMLDEKASTPTGLHPSLDRYNQETIRHKPYKSSKATNAVAAHGIKTL